jgi:hypothetical protein
MGLFEILRSVCVIIKLDNHPVTHIQIIPF